MRSKSIKSIAIIISIGMLWQQAVLAYEDEFYYLRPISFSDKTLRPDNPYAGLKAEDLLTKEGIVRVWRLTALSGPSARLKILETLKPKLTPENPSLPEFNKAFIPYVDQETVFNNWGGVAEYIKKKGIDIDIYRTAYGDLAIYFFLRDISEANYRIITGSSQTEAYRDPINRSPCTTHIISELNEVFDGKVFKRGYLPVKRFFTILQELVGNPEEYQGVEGMLKLAKWLQKRGETTHLGDICSVFGGGNADSLIKMLTGKDLPGGLGWEKIHFPYQRLVETANELVEHPEEYQGVEGMLKLAKWLERRGETTHLGDICSAFGGDRVGLVVKVLTDKDLPQGFDLEWKTTNFPYKRLIKAANELVEHPNKYKRVEGMLELAAWLDRQGETTNLEHLYSAFGGDEVGLLVKVLTDKDLPQGFDLEWEYIAFPYDLAVELINKALQADYAGQNGFDKLLQELKTGRYQGVPESDLRNWLNRLIRPEERLPIRLAIVQGATPPAGKATNFGTRGTYNEAWHDLVDSVISEKRERPDTVRILMSEAMLREAPGEMEQKMGLVHQLLRGNQFDFAGGVYHLYLLNGDVSDVEMSDNPYCLVARGDERIYMHAGTGGEAVHRSVRSVYMTSQLFDVLPTHLLAELIMRDASVANRRVEEAQVALQAGRAVTYSEEAQGAFDEEKQDEVIGAVDECIDFHMRPEQGEVENHGILYPRWRSIAIAESVLRRPGGMIHFRRIFGPGVTVTGRMLLEHYEEIAEEHGEDKAVRQMQIDEIIIAGEDQVVLYTHLRNKIRRVIRTIGTFERGIMDLRRGPAMAIAGQI